MEKLKTLKDLEFKYQEDDKLHCTDEESIREVMEISHDRGHFIEDLKELAVEWILNLENTVLNSNEIESFKGIGVNINSYQDNQKGIINWIKHFFGIKTADFEKDLLKKLSINIVDNIPECKVGADHSTLDYKYCPDCGTNIENKE